MGRQRQSWPNETLGPLDDILQSVSELRPILRVCLNEGIEHQNYNLIKILLPRIENKATVIFERIRLIQSIADDLYTAGRPPKWLTITNKLIEVGFFMTELYNELQACVRPNRWITGKRLLELLLESCEYIERKTREVPFETVPEAFKEERFGF